MNRELPTRTNFGFCRPQSIMLQAAPLRRPPWLTAATDESSVFSQGTIPFDWPLVPRISDPRERMRWYATPMPRAVTALASRYDLPCQVSLEEYMACAVGGCAGCAVAIRTAEGPAMKRVCVDGPVFDAAAVVWDADG